MQLSSELTLVSKFIGPGVFLSTFGLVSVVMLVQRAHAAPLVAGVTAAAFAMMWVTCFPLKEVIARDHGLYVNNFFEVVFVPYSQVAEVSYAAFGSRNVTLLLKTPCRFGKKIVFLPYTYFTFGMREHPVVEFLRVRCG